MEPDKSKHNFGHVNTKLLLYFFEYILKYISLLDKNKQTEKHVNDLAYMYKAFNMYWYGLG